MQEAVRSSRAIAALFVPWPRFRTPVPQRLLFAPQDLRTADPTVAADIYAGYFVFAGRALATGGRSPFDFAPPSHGWGEAFYGFGWLRHLRAADTAIARANARSLVADFLKRGRREPPVARETHVVARRLVAFLAQSPLLPDGGHIGRNPRVVLELLLDLLPLRQTFASRGIEAPEALMQAIDRMLPMLRLLRHGDGTLSHFNGMGRTAADHLATLLMYDEARAQPLMHAPHSGYERLAAGDTLMVADVGAAPATRFSAEAHAGCLSFELSSGGSRMVVNCGASSGARNGLATAGRATAAHSTVTVADVSSCRFVDVQGWWGERA